MAMNKINGQSYNEFTFNAALRQVDKVIKLASQYEGRCYGPYVRDVLIPRLNDPTVLCEYSKVHLEFPTHDQHNLFIIDLKVKYDNVVNIGGDWHLKIQNMHIAILVVDVIIPNTNIFDVNALIYRYHDNEYQFYDETTNGCYDSYNDDHSYLVLKTPLGKKILDKQMTMRSELLKPSLVMHQYFIDNLNTIIAKGWTVRFGNIVQTIPFEKIQFENDLKNCNVNTMDEFKNAYKNACEAIEKRDTLFNKCLTEYNLLTSSDHAIKELMMKALCQ